MADNIPLAMLLVFGGAKLAGEVCERLGQPAIVGEIMAGFVIGPGAQQGQRQCRTSQELHVSGKLHRAAIPWKRRSEIHRVADARCHLRLRTALQLLIEKDGKPLSVTEQEVEEAPFGQSNGKVQAFIRG